LVARVVRDDEVAGSNPVTPTKQRADLCSRLFATYKPEL